MNKQALSDYLDRIAFTGEITADLNTLVTLHRQQHRSIAFENLDIINGQKIDLTKDAIIQKLVYGSRGGYCFELNGLLNQVLKALGFDVEQKLARVLISGEPSGRSHLVSIVTLDQQQWLIDAGFGSNTPRSPIPLKLNQVFNTDRQTFRFIEDKSLGKKLQSKDQGVWIDLYSLDMGYVCEGDIEYGNHYTSTSPNSLFTNNLIAVTSTDQGTITLFNNQLKVTNANTVSETFIEDVDSYHKALKTYFSIDSPILATKMEQLLLYFRDLDK